MGTRKTESQMPGEGSVVDGVWETHLLMAFHGTYMESCPSGVCLKHSIKMFYLRFDEVAEVCNPKGMGVGGVRGHGTTYLLRS